MTQTGPLSQFQADTALTQIDHHRFAGNVSAAWNIGANPNGGYLVSLALNALSQTLTHPDPISITTHYLRPGVADEPCEVVVEPLRAGRTLSTARATLIQAGKTRLEVLTSFADLSAPVDVPHEITIPCPPLPDLDACTPRSADAQGVALPINQRVDCRINPAVAVPGAAGKAQMSGFIRLADGTEPDSRTLCMFADVLPPSLFGLLGSIGWVPTVELTVHVRRRPAPGWVYAQLDCEDLTGGRMVESGCLWDSEGHLVAQSRQIGLLLNNGS